jgi:hypothetical protein
LKASTSSSVNHWAIDATFFAAKLFSYRASATFAYYARENTVELILIILVIVLLFGGGGYYGHRRGYYGGGGIGIIGVLAIVLVVFLLFGGGFR